MQTETKPRPAVRFRTLRQNSTTIQRRDERASDASRADGEKASRVAFGGPVGDPPKFRESWAAREVSGDFEPPKFMEGQAICNVASAKVVQKPHRKQEQLQRQQPQQNRQRHQRPAFRKAGINIGPARGEGADKSSNDENNDEPFRNEIRSTKTIGEPVGNENQPTKNHNARVRIESQPTKIRDKPVRSESRPAKYRVYSISESESEASNIDLDARGGSDYCRLYEVWYRENYGVRSDRSPRPAQTSEEGETARAVAKDEGSKRVQVKEIPAEPEEEEEEDEEEEEKKKKEEEEIKEESSRPSSEHDSREESERDPRHDSASKRGAVPETCGRSSEIGPVSADAGIGSPTRQEALEEGSPETPEDPGKRQARVGSYRRAHERLDYFLKFQKIQVFQMSAICDMARRFAADRSKPPKLPIASSSLPPLSAGAVRNGKNCSRLNPPGRTDFGQTTAPREHPVQHFPLWNGVRHGGQGTPHFRYESGRHPFGHPGQCPKKTVKWMD